jgi:hypothetical protein
MPHRLLLGSAPSLSPDDFCALYLSNQAHCYADSTMKERRKYIPNPKQPWHYREIRPGDEKLIEDQLKAKPLHEFIPLGGR